VAEVPHPGARRVYEEGRRNRVWVAMATPAKASQPTSHCILSDRQPPAVPCMGSKNFSSVQGTGSARRLPRNRSLRLHGVLGMLGGVVGSGLSAPKNGFCG
jgi:hypothetical protein